MSASEGAVQALAARLERNYGGAVGLMLLPTVLEALASERPVSFERLARAVGLPPDLEMNDAPIAYGMVAHVFGPRAEWDQGRHLAFLGLGPGPGPHRILIEGGTLYSRGLAEALLLPSLAWDRYRLELNAADSGPVVTVQADWAGAPIRVEPASAVLAVPPGDEEPELYHAPEAPARARPGLAMVPLLELLRPPAPWAGPAGKGRLEMGSLVERMMTAFATGDTVKDLKRVKCRLAGGDGRGPSAPSALEAGDFWWDPAPAGKRDSPQHRARGGGPHLMLRLPNGLDWDLDGPMSNGRGWHRVGTPPTVTAVPSVMAWDYHGILAGGTLIGL